MSGKREKTAFAVLHLALREVIGVSEFASKHESAPERRLRALP